MFVALVAKGTVNAAEIFVPTLTFMLLPSALNTGALPIVTAISLLAIVLQA